MATTKFPLGQLVATPSALTTFTPEEQHACLRRHASGDWGDLTDEDRKANDASLLDGSRILSSYVFEGDRKLWIITEAADETGDRVCTTLLEPNEY